MILYGEFSQQYQEKFAEIRAYYECDHVGLVHNTKKTIKGGTIQIVQQCQGCGEKTSTALARKHFTQEQFDAMPPFNALREQERRDYQNNLILQWREYFYKKQEQAKQNRTREYDRYLQSAEWKRKRDLVIQRAGGICEGCGINRATQAHHLHYEHLYNEFLWELKAVCRECHERVHEIGKGGV